MVFIHENKEMLENKGLMSKLSKMQKSKLDEFLGKVNLKDQMMTGNIEQILMTMDAEYGLMGEVEEEKETKELMDLWSTSDISESEEVYKKWDMEKSSKEREKELEI